MKLLGTSIILLASMLMGCDSANVENTPSTETGLSPDEQRILDWSTQHDQAPTATEQQNAASVGSLMAGLEARLEENPDDAGGWTLLAQSYAFTGRMEDAQRAADRAISLGADAEQVRSLLVAAHTRADGR